MGKFFQTSFFPSEDVVCVLSLPLSLWVLHLFALLNVLVSLYLPSEEVNLFWVLLWLASGFPGFYLQGILSRPTCLLRNPHALVMEPPHAARDSVGYTRGHTTFARDIGQACWASSFHINWNYCRILLNTSPCNEQLEGWLVAVDKVSP